MTIVILIAGVLLIGCGSSQDEVELQNNSNGSFEQEIETEKRDGQGRRGGQSKLDRIQQGGERGAPE